MSARNKYMAKVSTAILDDDAAVLVCVSAYLLVCIVLSLLSPVFFFSVCHTHKVRHHCNGFCHSREEKTLRS